MNEAQTQQAIIRALGVQPGLRIWRANVGTGVPYSVVTAAMGQLRAGNPAAAHRILASARPIQFGVPGQADLTGIVRGGLRLEVEVKSDSGRQTEDQRNYQSMIERLGGRYLLARSVEDLADIIQEARG